MTTYEIRTETIDGRQVTRRWVYSHNLGKTVGRPQTWSDTLQTWVGR